MRDKVFRMMLKRPFSDIDWLQTPEMVRQYVLHLERMVNAIQEKVEAHEKRIEDLEARRKESFA